MQDFIKAAAARLAVDEGSVQTATGGLLGLLKDQAQSADVQSLFTNLPGAEALASNNAGAGGGGLFGALAGSLGGGLGGAAGLLGSLQGAGLNTDQLGSLATMLVDYAKQHAGEDLVEKIVAQVPALKTFLG